MSSGASSDEPIIFERRESFTLGGGSSNGGGDCKLVLIAEALPQSSTDIDNKEIDVKVSITLQNFLQIDLPSRGRERGRGAAAAASAFIRLPVPPGPVRCSPDNLWMLFSRPTDFPELLTEKITAFRCSAVEAALKCNLVVTRVHGEFEYVMLMPVDKVEELADRRRMNTQQGDIHQVTESLGFCKGCINDVSGKDWFVAVRLACSHVFHVGCIYKKLQKKLSCPYCGSKSIFLDCSSSTVGFLMREENPSFN